MLILIAIFLLSSCINGGTSKRTVYKGYKSLEATFSKSIPDNLYENSTFYTRVIIVNEGTYTINASNPAVASITTDEFYMQYNRAQWQGNKTFTLEGKSTMFPNGEFIIFDLPNISMQLLPGAIQKPKTELQFNLCYPYETIFSENICIDVDPYEQDQRPKICKSEELTLGGGQGSPLAVTKITPIMTSTSNNIKPQFIIEIKNYGKGIPLYDETDDKLCGNLILNTDNLNKVRISGAVSDLNLTCNPEIIKLIDNEGQTRCTVDSHFGSATNFVAPLNLKIEFNYFQSISKEFNIIRTQEYNPLSFAASRSCEGLNEGSYCSSDSSMVCDAEKQCITRCSYCAENPGKLPELCRGISVDYTCGCESDDRYFMSPTEYVSTACDFGLCCDQGERGIGIYYSFKNHIYGKSYSEYKLVKEDKNLALTPLTDYKFKPFYSSPNAYCVFRMLKQYNGGQGLELLFTTDRNLCSNPSNVLDYLFNETEVEEKYTLQVAAYETLTSETPIKASSHELTIKEVTSCQYNGQILPNNLVCSLEFDRFYERNKCVFCNMDWNEDIDFCKTKNSGFINNMTCSCEEKDFNYLNEASYIEDETWCQRRNFSYCCIRPKLLYFSMVRGDNSIHNAVISEANTQNSSEDTIYLDLTNDPIEIEFFGSNTQEDEICNFEILGTHINGGSFESIDSRTWDCSQYNLSSEIRIIPDNNLYESYTLFACTNKKENYYSESLDNQGCYTVIIDNIENIGMDAIECDGITSCADYNFDYYTFEPEEICFADPCSTYLENNLIDNFCYWENNQCKTFECTNGMSCGDYDLLIESLVINASAVCDPQDFCRIGGESFKCSWDQENEHCYEQLLTCENGIYNNNQNLCNDNPNCYYNEDASMCRDCPTDCNNQVYNYYEEECDNGYNECGLNFRCYHTGSECTDCPSSCNGLLGVSYGNCEDKGDTCGLDCKWQSGVCINW